MSGNGNYQSAIAEADRTLADLEAEASQIEHRLAAAARHREKLVAASMEGLHRSQMSDADKSKFIRNHPDGPAAAIRAYFELPK